MPRFRFAKFYKPDLKLGFRFCPQTEPNWTMATLGDKVMDGVGSGTLTGSTCIGKGSRTTGAGAGGIGASTGIGAARGGAGGG